jgi:hypothetical protein
MNKPYRGDGNAIKNHPDGRKEMVRWDSLTWETRDNIYSIRQYSDGTVVRSHNCEVVDSFTARVKHILEPFEVRQDRLTR